MFASFVDQRRHRAPVDVFDPTADEREPLTRKIRDLRCEIQFSFKPGTHGMLIRRNHIGQMCADEGTNMAVGQRGQQRPVTCVTNPNLPCEKSQKNSGRQG